MESDGRGSKAPGDVVSLAPTTSRYYYLAQLESEDGRPLSPPIALDPNATPPRPPSASPTRCADPRPLIRWRRGPPRSPRQQRGRPPVRDAAPTAREGDGDRRPAPPGPRHRDVIGGGPHDRRGRRPMFLVLFLAGWLLVTLAHVQAPATPGELPGTYTVETPRGNIVVRLDVARGRVTGTLDVTGSRTLSRCRARGGRPVRARHDVLGGRHRRVRGPVEGRRSTSGSPRGPRSLPLHASSGERERGRAAADGVPRSPPPDVGPPRARRAREGWPRRSPAALIRFQKRSTDESEEFLVFRADGSYAYGKGRSVAGGSGWSFEGGGGGPTETGAAGAPRTASSTCSSSDGQWGRVGRYGMTDDGQTMRIIYDRGGRKLWSRQ